MAGTPDNSSMSQNQITTNASAATTAQILTASLAKLGSSIIPGTEESVVWPAKMIRSKADAMEVGLDQFSKTKNKHYIVIACDTPRYVSREEFDELDLAGPGWQPQKFTRVQITAPHSH